ncbi:MAG TPA: hypothetical protein VGP33_03535, partial [Chloroflexota bacterium]|nr:hypothetical protein [Chloroflexota bacterium]
MRDHRPSPEHGALSNRPLVDVATGPEAMADDLRRVEACLLTEKSVESCAVLALRVEGGETLVVAYVVPVGPFVADRLHAWLHERLPQAALPSVFVPITCLPLTPKGALDEGALLRLEVVDETVRRRWETALQALPGVEQVAVVIGESVQRAPMLHRSQLPPDCTPSAPSNGRSHLASQPLA